MSHPDPSREYGQDEVDNTDKTLIIYDHHCPSGKRYILNPKSCKDEKGYFFSKDVRDNYTKVEVRNPNDL